VKQKILREQNFLFVSILFIKIKKYKNKIAYPYFFAYAKKRAPTPAILFLYFLIFICEKVIHSFVKKVL
jgi:hypothetical protein